MTRLKVLSAGLIAAAMLTTPLMAREHRHVARGYDVSAPRGVLDGRRVFWRLQRLYPYFGSNGARRRANNGADHGHIRRHSTVLVSGRT